MPSEVSFPVGVPVIWKVFRCARSLYTGGVDGAEVYGETWPDIICRNKLPVTETPADHRRHDVLEAAAIAA